MRQTTLSLPELGILAATRGMIGAGAMLLFGSNIPDKKRKMIGWPLFLAGALSTVPLVIDVIRKSHYPPSAEEPIAKGRSGKS